MAAKKFDVDPEDLKQLYEERRFTIRQIAGRYQMSYGTAHRLLRRAGVKFRKSGGGSASKVN